MYNLDEDIAEEYNLATEYPEIINQLTKELESLVQRGTSRSGPNQLNDTDVRFDIIQTKRWSPAKDGFIQDATGKNQPGGGK